jgi:DNA repair protein RecN (Recombination protein N)
VLLELHVRNLAVLAEASVTFGDGLNVLSGETGAGKSIVVDSLFLLAGARASSDLIRAGAEALTVSGVFAPAGEEWRRVLDEAGIAGTSSGGADGGESEELLVRREIGHNGRNRVFVNDQPTTLRLLADLAPYLLRIHGQRDEMELLAADLQREWLDASGGDEAVRLLARAADACDRHARLAERLARLHGDERLRRERIELLRFQAAEIDAARPRGGEDDELRREREVLRHAEAIAQALGTAYGLLADDEGAAADRIARGQALLAGIAAWEPQAAGWEAELEEVRIRLSELATTLGRRLDGLDADPARLDAVEERLQVLERLCRRHGGDLGVVLARREEMTAELAELEGDAGNQDELEARAAAVLAEVREAALALSAARRGWGDALAAGIEAELTDLGLGRARLAVHLARRRRAGSPLVVDGEPVDFGPRGIDQVTLLFAPNPGEEPRPLARIASGGELSRLHLALQLAAGAGRGAGPRPAAARPTLVFDEIDAGIGGAEAAALGRKLQRLAAGRQILAVTHLPQVASHADLHFRVRKTVSAGRTSVQVEKLPPRARVEEVARMLAGDKLTPLSLSHAEELIAGAARAPRDTGGRARRPAPA